jgi:hypothetical protein
MSSRQSGKIRHRGWLELPDMTILESGPWYGDDVIPAEIFSNPNQGEPQQSQEMM